MVRRVLYLGFSLAALTAAIMLLTAGARPL